MKVIRDQKSYEDALARVDELAALDPDPASTEGEELEVLSILIEDYERRQYHVERPSPLEAIEFRMEQAGLSQRDLVPFIGSKSKTSEVLSGRRPLSLPMVRALSSGLGIPADVLVREERSSADATIDLGRFPVKEIAARNWFADTVPECLGQTIVALLDTFGGEDLALAARASAHVRAGREMDMYSLMAWAAWTVHEAQATPPAAEFRADAIDHAFLSRIVKLSPSDTGPVDARRFLERHGIALVVVRHLPRTYLDGALILGRYPIIALTLRHDRIDSFWFTLLHELAHLFQVCSSAGTRSFFDDLEVDSPDQVEVEADALAGETLIPKSAWVASPASKLRSPEAAQHLAAQLGIHPAIVAGRIRHAAGDYRKLSRMVGQGQVRRLLETPTAR